MESYIKRIRDLREDNDKKQEELAKILNTTQTNYSKYERNERKISVEQIIKLCIFYDISADYLLGFTNKQKPLPKN